jgi:hypothetical protein
MKRNGIEGNRVEDGRCRDDWVVGMKNWEIGGMR